MQTIALTGGTGLVGRRLVEKLAHKYKFKILVRRAPHGKMRNCEYVEADLLTDSTVKGFCEGCGALVHLAGTFDMTSSGGFALNVLGTHNMIDEAARSGVKNIIYFSSGTVYGEPKGGRASREGDALEPNTTYGLSRMLGEHIVSFYAKKYSQRSIILRPSNIYGPGSRKGVIYTYISNILAGKPIIVHGSGRQARDFVFVDDIADAIEKALNYGGTGTFNLSTGGKISLVQLISLLEKKLGAKAQIMRQPIPSSHTKDIWLSPARAKKILKWRAKTEFDDGLEKTIAWVRANR